MTSSLRFITLTVLLCVGAMLLAQQTPAAQTPKDQAWSVLNNGLTNSNADKRTRAVRESGLLIGDQQAKDAAVIALKDPKPEVRAAAARRWEKWKLAAPSRNWWPRLTTPIPP